MSEIVISQEIVSLIPTIGKEAFVIYVFLCSRADKSNNSQPSYAEIREGTCCGRGTISQSIELLEKFGLIKKQKRYSKSCVYHILNSETPVVRLMNTNSTLIKDSILEFTSRTTDISTTNELLDKPLTPFQIISTKFMNLTHIPERFDPRWIESVKTLVNMGVTEEILTLAVEELGTKYNLSGPWSVINACANVMRKNGHEQETRPKTDEERVAEMIAEDLRKAGLG